MPFARHRAFIGDNNRKNPLPNRAETFADGKEAFSHSCVACRGMGGQNTNAPFSKRSMRLREEEAGPQ